MKNNKETSPKVARIASKLLKNATSKKVKSVAASTLSQAKPKKKIRK